MSEEFNLDKHIEDNVHNASESIDGKFQVVAEVSKIKTLASNTLRIQFDCNEIDPELVGFLFSLKRKGSGWLLFKPNPIEAEDVPEIEAPEVEGKTPSKRLRDRMFVYYKKKNGGDASGFDSYYKDYLNKLGEKFLEKASEYEE